MYKNIVPLSEVSANPRVGPQINTSSDILGSRQELGVYVGGWVSKVLVCWVHHSTHEQDGTWKVEMKTRMSPHSRIACSRSMSETKAGAWSYLGQQPPAFGQPVESNLW